MMFLSNKGEQYYSVRYRSEFARFLKSSERELRSVHEAYPNDYVARDVNAQDERWRSIFDLQEAIFGDGDQWSDFRRGKLLRDLHDNFSHLAAKRFLSRTNFVSCALKALKRTAKDERLMQALDAVYTSFDVHSKEQFDWRSFLFYMHVALDAARPAKEQILSAFSKLCSASGIDLRDLGQVLFQLVKASAMAEVLCAMDEAWAQVKASQSQLDDNTESTKLTKEVFEQMLELDGMQSFFEQSDSPWGKGRTFPVHICQWEEDIYNAVLLQRVKASRRAVAVADKLARDDRSTKLNVWRCWAEYARYQGALRAVCNNINRRMEINRKQRGWNEFSRRVIDYNASLDLQRVGRGFLGRLVARHAWLLFSSATLIQTHWRMHLANKRVQALSVRYYQAIVDVQRHIRGALGRRFAFRRLMTRVDQERRKNEAERERLEMERGIWCLTKLQAFWRRKRATTKTMELRQKRERETLTRRAMETERTKFLRERQIYQRQLEKFYQSMKDEQSNSQRIESKVAHDQIKVRTLRRRLKNEEIKSLPPDMTEHFATEACKSEWEARIEAGVEEMKASSVQCLDRPDNSVEKKTRTVIRKRIKGRVSDVLARADEQGIPMETKEAKAIAREEITHMIGEEERARLRSEMETAFQERTRLKEEERIQAEAKARAAHARATLYAVSIVAVACRKWLARKELRRLCLETYERDFDEQSHAFYYRHKATGETSWIKPKAMGASEIPAKDEWKLLRDAHDFPYYFNPRSIQMRWTPPNGVDMCCGVVPHTWWREYPVRSGSCPNFGRLLNEGDGKRYCEECLMGGGSSTMAGLEAVVDTKLACA